MDSGFTYRSPNTSRRFLVTSLNLTVATFLLAFGEAAVTATIKNPTTNFRARPFTVARIQLAVERAGETFPRPDVVRAEAGDTNSLWCRQRDPDVLVNPRQRLVTLNSVYLIAFGLRQLHTLRYWLAVNAGCPRQIVQTPDPSRYAVRLLPSFSFRN